MPFLLIGKVLCIEFEQTQGFTNMINTLLIKKVIVYIMQGLKSYLIAVVEEKIKKMSILVVNVNAMVRFLKTLK